MTEAMVTPRINATYLDNFTNQTVRLVGKVVQLRGEQVTVDSMGNVTAHLNRVRERRFLMLELRSMESQTAKRTTSLRESPAIVKP